MGSVHGCCHVTRASEPLLRRLAASWLVRLLPPHHRDFNKRLVKTAKLYFLDAGLAAWLLGIKDAATLTHRQ